MRKSRVSMLLLSLCLASVFSGCSKEQHDSTKQNSKPKEAATTEEIKNFESIVEEAPSTDDVIVYTDVDYQRGESWYTYLTTIHVETPGNEKVGEKITNSDVLKELYKNADSVANDYKENAEEVYYLHSWAYTFALYEAYANTKVLSLQFRDFPDYMNSQREETYYSQSFDTQTGKPVSFRDILDLKENPDAEKELSQMLVTKFREFVGDAAYDADFAGEEEQMLQEKMAKEWRFTTEGIAVIAPGYVDTNRKSDNFEAVIPYEQLKGIVKAEYIEAATKESEQKDGKSELHQDNDYTKYQKRYRNETDYYLTGDGCREFKFWDIDYESFKNNLLFYATDMKEDMAAFLPEPEDQIIVNEYAGEQAEQKVLYGTGTGYSE